MDIAEETRLYQAALEHRRAGRDQLQGVLSALDELDELDEGVRRQHAELLKAYYG